MVSSAMQSLEKKRSISRWWSVWDCSGAYRRASRRRAFCFSSGSSTTRTVPKAMALVLLYYAVFTPTSTLLGSWLTDTLGWNDYLVTVLNMLLNFATEYLYDRLVVFRGSIDTGAKRH